MRDPNRIPKVLEAVQKFWEKNPDWRLGQLLINVIAESRVAPRSITLGGEVWNCEDDKLLEYLEKMEKRDE